MSISAKGIPIDDDFIVRIFCVEILNRGNAANVAIRRLIRQRETFGARMNNLTYDESLEIFETLDSFLSSCAIISWSFWPYTNSASVFSRRRGELLRERFSIGEGNLLMNKVVRNKLQHFDEQLDNWLEKSGKPKIRNLIVDDGTYSEAPDEELFTFYNFNTSEYRFRSWGVNIQDLNEARVAIHELAKELHGQLMSASRRNLAAPKS